LFLTKVGEEKIKAEENKNQKTFLLLDLLIFLIHQKLIKEEKMHIMQVNLY